MQSKSTVDGLGIALRLVDMLPTIPLQLAFNTANSWAAQVHTRGLCCAAHNGKRWPRFSHAPPPGSDQDAMTVLSKEILKSAHVVQKRR